MDDSLALALQKNCIDPFILAQYALKVKKLQPFKAVYRLETDQGPKMLKRSNVTEPKLLYIYEAMDYLFKQGFKQVPPFIPTIEGLPYVTYNGDYYFLSDWVKGRESDFRSRSDLDLVTRTLAEFHKTAKGLVLSPQAKTKFMWGKWPESFASRCQDLHKFEAIAEAKAQKGPFDRKYLANLDYYYNMGQEALQTLANSRYQELVEEAKKDRCFCHRDVAGRNFIITPDKKCFLIDFDYSRFDVRITDLFRLLERTMKKVHWDINAAKHILNIYNSVYPMEAKEYPVLLAFMQFPQKFWRLSERYYSKSKDWPDNKYAKKLKLLLGQRMAKEIFLQKFRDAFCR